MKSVSLFEANLLRILRGFFGREPADRVLRLVESETACPKCLSRNAVELVEDTLQKGVAGFLARLGGWRRARFMRDGRIAEGRLWNRTPPAELGLSFSGHSLRFLMWLTANHPNRSRLERVPAESELTLGDRLLLFLAYETLRGTEPIRGLMEQPPFRRHALLWLAYLPDFVEAEPRRSWDFAPWMDGPGSWIVESLQPRLSEAWLKMERQKSRIVNPNTMRRLGELQRRVLTQFFDAAEAAGRQDLCRFFLAAMNRYLQDASTAGQPVPFQQLHLKSLRMADRFEVYRAAAAGLRQMDRLDHWNRVARSIGFYDEGYAAAQLWKADWEDLEGDRLCAESQTRLRQLEPLGAGGSGTRTSASSEASNMKPET